MKKVKIKKLGQYRQGGYINPIPGAHPAYTGSFGAPSSYYPSDAGNEMNTEVRGTLEPAPREHATLEAEKGETVITNLTQGGIPEFYKIGGKRHYDGGTPLNLPADSFIFSRDRKMKIKDKDVLEQFGITKAKRGGVTPADISKKYDINKYRKILADPSSDKYQRETAEMMIQNYNYKLGGLAMVQESMKGFDNGIPAVAVPYLEQNGINPSEFIEQAMPAQPQMPMARYGGNSYYNYGGMYMGNYNVPKYKSNFNAGELIKFGVGNEVPETMGQGSFESPYSAEMFANVTTPEQAINLWKGQRTASGEDLAFEDPTTLKLLEQSGEYSDQAYFDALEKYTGMKYEQYTDDMGIPGWRPVEQATAPVTPPPSDKPFTPGFKYEGGKLYQKRQGKVTGEEHWEASNPMMAAMYAKKYGTGDMSRADIQKQIADNPEAFATTWGQQAQEDAQLAELTLKKMGGNALPKYQTQGEVEYGFLSDQEMQLARALGISNPGANVSATREAIRNAMAAAQAEAAALPPEENYITQADFDFKNQRVRVNPTNNKLEVVDLMGNLVGILNPGGAPVTSTKSTRYQNVPDTATKWDMTKKGYDETKIKPGHFVKKKDGKWYKVTKLSTEKSPYTGTFSDPRLGELQESYGRFEQLLADNPNLVDDIVKKHKEYVSKLKPRKNLSQADIDAMNLMSPEDIINNLKEAQKQVMAINAKMPEGYLASDAAKNWDKDRSVYENTIRDLEFNPLNPAQTAAFQASYVGIRDLARDKKYSELLKDFIVAPTGARDEKGVQENISEIDGWWGNTTMGQGLLYDPQGQQLEMEEADWKEGKSRAIKHLDTTAPYQDTPFWTQDIANLAFALGNRYGIKRYNPYEAVPAVKLPTPTFMDPRMQVQNILGAQRNILDAASTFGTPGTFAATAALSQGMAGNQVANAIASVQNQNAQIANQFEMQRANIMNRAADRKAQLSTRLHDKYQKVSQDFDNTKRKAGNEVLQAFNQAWTNRGMTQTMNELYDQYNVDPVTGFTYMGPGRDLAAKDPSSKDIAVQANQLMRMLPGLDAKDALAQASKMLGVSPTKGTGVDPADFAYPGGMPYGYYPGA